MLIKNYWEDFCSESHQTKRSITDGQHEILLSNIERTSSLIHSKGLLSIFELKKFDLSYDL